MTLLSNIFWILHLVVSQWTQLLLIMDKKIMQKFHFKIWRCNVSKPKPVTQTDRLWEIQRKSIIKTVCRDILVFYYIYLTPVKNPLHVACGEISECWKCPSTLCTVHSRHWEARWLGLILKSRSSPHKFYPWTC